MRVRSLVGQLLTAVSRTAPESTSGKAVTPGSRAELIAALRRDSPAFARAFSRPKPNEPVGRNLRGANPRNADLSAMNLNAAPPSDVDLSFAILLDVDLRGADLSGANLSGANLSGANLSDANLRGAALVNADLKRARLRGADLGDADLSGANLRSAHLIGGKLAGAEISGANLRSAFLDAADLSGVCFIGADLTNAYLRNADLSSADLRGVNLTGAGLKGAILTNANLSGAVLTNADLVDANLSGANVAAAVLVSANLSGADFTGADLWDADLSGANLTSAVLIGADLSGAVLTNANLRRARLLRAKLVDARLTGANLGDVDLRDVMWNSTTYWPAELAEAIRNASEELPDGTLQVREPDERSPKCVTVSDDGAGFDARAAPARSDATGIGVKEGAALRDAELDIRHGSEDRTQVRLKLSLSEGRAGSGFKTLLLLVEDHVAVRQAIAAMFKGKADFEVVRQASSLAKARSMLDDVDIAIVDLDLPDGWGGDLIAELRARNPRSQALVLSASLDRAEIARAIESGAAGILEKTARLDEVVSVVRRLRAGEALLPMDELVELLGVAARRRERERDDRRVIESLTVREREVLQALSEGLNSQQVAERLHITVRTERNHVASILAKLGVNSRLQALVFALRYEIVEIPERR
jgi:uncharacterized protein YjbI with pentapeptide repeats/DNA-binding NarL/FixJ family response regulator